MREVEFTIDPTTGGLEMHVKGIAGSPCDDIAKLAKELLGEPGREVKTGEYCLRPGVQPRVHGKSSQ